MKIANDLVQEIKFERVHRMGERWPGKNRAIVAKFNLLKEREMVRNPEALSKFHFFSFTNNFQKKYRKNVGN